MRVNGAKAIPMKRCHKEFYEKVIQKQSIDRNKYLRAKILLLAHSGLNNSEVKREVGLSYKTIRKWRCRWIEGYEELCELEHTEEQEYLQNFLRDYPRSGLPKKFTEAQEKAIVAMACREPREFGIEMTDWTMEMLSKVAEGEKIVESISKSQVARLLKNTDLATT